MSSHIDWLSVRAEAAEGFTDQRPCQSKVQCSVIIFINGLSIYNKYAIFRGLTDGIALQLLFKPTHRAIVCFIGPSQSGGVLLSSRENLMDFDSI